MCGWGRFDMCVRRGGVCVLLGRRGWTGVHYTHTHTHTQVCRSGTLFRCRVMDGLPGRCILPTDVDHPFYYSSVDK